MLSDAEIMAMSVALADGELSMTAAKGKGLHIYRTADKGTSTALTVVFVGKEYPGIGYYSITYFEPDGTYRMHRDQTQAECLALIEEFRKGR